MTRDEIIALGQQAAIEHRRERALPEQITDPSVLSDIAAMLRPTRPATKKRRR